MAMPLYAKCLEENGEERWDDIMDQFQSTHRLLWDEKTRLYLHGCDVSRKADWADPVTGRSPGVWLRAEGWFLMALADVYELAKDHTPRAGELALLLKYGLDGLCSIRTGSPICSSRRWTMGNFQAIIPSHREAPWQPMP